MRTSPFVDFLFLVYRKTADGASKKPQFGSNPGFDEEVM